MANTTDSTPGFQRGYYDLEPFFCKSLCAVRKKCRQGAALVPGESRALRCTHTVGHPSLCWPWAPKVSTTVVASGERVFGPALASSPDKS